MSDIYVGDETTRVGDGGGSDDEIFGVKTKEAATRWMRFPKITVAVPPKQAGMRNMH